MEVTKGNKLNMKRLYHIQSITDWSDEPYDLFVWSEQWPTAKDIMQLYLNEREDLKKDDPEVLDFMENHNVYTVYAEEI